MYTCRRKTCAGEGGPCEPAAGVPAGAPRGGCKSPGPAPPKTTNDKQNKQAYKLTYKQLLTRAMSLYNSRIPRTRPSFLGEFQDEA